MTRYHQICQELPPILCRLLARHPNGSPLTTEEIASASGLLPIRVLVLSEMMTWNGVPLDDHFAFTLGCQMEFDNARQMKRARAYARALEKGLIARPFRYLERSPDYESYYLRLRQKCYQHKI